MYLTKGVNLYVKSKGMLSESFHSDVGVRQGDPASPILFKLFINDIGSYIGEENAPTLNGMKLSHLLYADDIVLLADNEKQLQKAVKGVEKFCNDWSLKVNTDKTKVMVFDKSGKMSNPNITYNGIELEVVDRYKYLGIQFHISGKFDVARQDLADRSLKAMHLLTSYFKHIQPSYKTCMHLFDRMVKPVMMYAADICGAKVTRYSSLYKEMRDNVFEKCHLRFCRYVLGVNRRTPVIGIYGDTGRYPMYLSALTAYLKYWYRLSESDKHQPLLYNAYKHNYDNNTPWLKDVKKCLHLAGLTLELVSASKYNINTIVERAVNYCKLKFREGWREELFNDQRRREGCGNKLRTYRIFKTSFGHEEYLYKCKSQIHRKNLTRLRLSSHKLRIETERMVSGAKRLKPEERICKFCTLNECEDEIHFVIKCPHYDEERCELVRKVKILFPGFDQLADNHKFIIILSAADSDVINLLGKFISDCFLKREA